MPYPTQSRLKPSRLMAEEVLVREALAGYNFEPSDTDFEDFAPILMLYQVYRKHVAACDKPPLTVQQFGVALRRAFGIDNDRKFRRRVNGPAVNGIAFVRGPGCVRTYVNPGRPKPAERKADASADSV